jgi:hypothetical protein
MMPGTGSIVIKQTKYTIETSFGTRSLRLTRSFKSDIADGIPQAGQVIPPPRSAYSYPATISKYLFDTHSHLQQLGI